MKLWIKYRIWNNSTLWWWFGAVCIFSAASFFPVLWAKAFYHLLAIGISAQTRAYYIKSQGRESVAAFIVWLWSLNWVLDEMFFNPKEIEINEYVSAFFMALYVIYTRKKWKR